MMRAGHWRRRLIPAVNDPVLASWLTEPGSLTARCQKAASRFQVELLRSGWLLPLGDEASKRCRRRVREVVLRCDGVPVIFAHSVLLTAANGRLNRWLGGLGRRSLGSLLFAYPGFARGPLAFCRLDARHPLYRTARAWSNGEPTLWARRSEHRLGAQVLRVTEVFLPGILALERDGVP